MLHFFYSEKSEGRKEVDLDGCKCSDEVFFLVWCRSSQLI
jgi:hypothetical protein